MTITSEDILGLPKPPSHQCERIDMLVMAIKCRSWDVNELVDEVEHLRESLEALRLWGNAWKDLAKANIDIGGFYYE